MAESKTNVPAGLALAERVLVLLREAAKGTALWETSHIRTEAMHGPTGPLGAMVLMADVPEDSWRRFLSMHWEAMHCKPGERASSFVADHAEPRVLEVTTTSRLGYLAFLKKAAKALDGAPLTFEEDTSWTWDHNELTSLGRPTHRTVYRLVVSLHASAFNVSEKPAFKASTWLKKSAAHVCTSSDERADRCMFQLAHEAGMEHAISSYEWTPKGVVLETASKEMAGKIKQKLFADCKVSIGAAKRNEPVVMTVGFP